MLVAFASAQDAATALADAQKSYVSGNWKSAAAAYEKACPMQPKEKQPECLLWNVLALSQTGEAASFKMAGKRLDSLIQKVNPQEAIYADLMMTSAQFRLYLGKYDKAAEDLIHAIETSQPHHNVVLQKVCAAVKAKVHSDALVERCESLKNPQPAAPVADVPKAEQPAQATSPAQAAPVQTATVPATTQPAAQAASSSSSAAVSAVSSAAAPTASAAPVPTSVAASVSSSSAAIVPAPAVPEQPKTTQAAQEQTAPATQPTSTTSQAVSAPAKPTSTSAAAGTEYWVLQLGAFGVKDNATLLVSTLKKRKIQAEIVEQVRGERTLYLVQSGHFATRDEAVDFGAKQLAPLKVEFQPLLKR